MCTARAKVVILNEYGLHARPATIFSQTAATFDSTVTISRRAPEGTADGRSLMSLLALAVTVDTEITIEASGPDADDAVETLVRLVASKFGEDAAVKESGA